MLDVTVVMLKDVIREITYILTLAGGGVLNFELGTDVRPQVSNTTL